MRFLFLVFGLVFASQSVGFDVNQVMGEQTSQKPKPGPAELSSGPYPTKQALLDAVASGEFRQYIEHLDYQRRVDLNASVFAILQSDYDLPSIKKYVDFPTSPGGTIRWNNRCLSAAGELSDAMFYFFEFRLDGLSRTQLPLPNFKHIQERIEEGCVSSSPYHKDPSGFGKQFLASNAKFMQDYSDAIDTYLAKLEEQGRLQETASAEARKAAAKAAAEKKSRQNIEAAREASIRAAETAKADAEKKSRQDLEAAREASIRAVETARQQAEASAIDAARKEREKRLDACVNSPASKTVYAAWEVERGEEMVAQGQADLARDDEIAHVSGATNLVLRRQAGVAIVTGKGLIEKSFEIYKTNGGTATVPAKVRGGPDPCGQYR